jgi:Ca2+-binding RTX toxin-like protein
MKTYFGTNGNDVHYGGGGRDRMYGFAGDDLFYGNDGRDKLKAGGGTDQLYGGLGEDKLRGGRGDDVIDAGDGNDIVNGGKGSDTLWGGVGADTFIFNTVENAPAGPLVYDEIADFDPLGGDTIDVRAFGLPGLAYDLLSDTTEISFAGSNQRIIVNGLVDITDLIF